MKKKYLSILMVCLMLTLVACSSSEDTTVQSSEKVTVSGEVVSITDNSLTLAVGTEKTMDKGEMPDESMPDSGDMPDESMPDSGDMPNEDMPESGDMPSGERPSGEKPSGDMSSDGEMLSMLDLTGEELTITIDENTVITSGNGDASEEVSISDISEGTVVSITYDESSMTAATITIKSMSFGGGAGGGNRDKGQGEDIPENIPESSSESL